MKITLHGEPFTCPTSKSKDGTACKHQIQKEIVSDKDVVPDQEYCVLGFSKDMIKTKRQNRLSKGQVRPEEEWQYIPNQTQYNQIQQPQQQQQMQQILLLR
jgi:hypothetical protein